MAKEIQSLEDIEQADWRKITRAIKESNGKVMVLVHPFFYERVRKAYNRVMDGLLVKSKIPVIILEEGKNVRKLKKHLKKLNAPKHLILPTDDADPKLVKSIDPKTKKPVLGKEEAELIELLEQTGAKKIFVGGMLTHF